MELQDRWNQFAASGRVEDYLSSDCEKRSSRRRNFCIRFSPFFRFFTHFSQFDHGRIIRASAKNVNPARLRKKRQKFV